MDGIAVVVIRDEPSVATVKDVGLGLRFHLSHQANHSDEERQPNDRDLASEDFHFLLLSS